VEVRIDVRVAETPVHDLARFDDYGDEDPKEGKRGVEVWIDVWAAETLVHDLARFGEYSEA